MHKSVLLQETIHAMNLSQGDSVIDLTVGAGGHSAAVLSQIGGNGKLLAIDKDDSALVLAQKNLKGHKNVTLVQGDFREIEAIAKKNGFKGVNAIIADLGVSSMQFDQKHRGFSFSGHDKLDMRMDMGQKLTAADILADYTEGELADILFKYGEEREAKRIARAIVMMREIRPILYTDQLAEVVRRVKRASARNYKFKILNFKLKRDPATQTFQALRIETNEELKALESALPQMVGLLTKGGRMAVISFHSLEDRIVKNFINEAAKECVCPPEFPKCVCGAKPKLKKITGKPIMAAVEETMENPRARSAKLRVAEKI